MLSRRKKQAAAHTFLEGTSGSYVPRSAPPPIPICVPSVGPQQQQQQQQNFRASPSPSPSPAAAATTAVTTLQKKPSSIQSINSVGGSIISENGNKKASTSSLAPSISSLVENAGGPGYGGRSEPPPQQQPPLPEPWRGGAHGRVPSGGSGGGGQPHAAAAPHAPHVPHAPLSSHSFNYEQRPQRKVLAPSLSFSMLESHASGSGHLANQPLQQQQPLQQTQQYPSQQLLQQPQLQHSQIDLRGHSVTEEPTSSQLPQHRFVSTSLQHLPVVARTAATTMGSTSIIEMTGNDAAVAGNAPEAELELPSNWSVESIVTHKQGTNEPVTLRYYVDHNTKRTHWLHPLVKEKLPAGWRKEYTPEMGVVYHNDHLGTVQYDHPGLAKSGGGPSPAAASLSASVGHNIGLQQQPVRPVQQLQQVQQQQQRAEMQQQQQAQQAHFNLVRMEEVPEWLRLYCSAPPSTDHLLDWTLFSLPNLEHYWALMYRLFRQDIIDAVRKKERAMLELQLEIARREQEWPR